MLKCATIKKSEHDFRNILHYLHPISLYEFYESLYELIIPKSNCKMKLFFTYMFARKKKLSLVEDCKKTTILSSLLAIPNVLKKH